MAHVVLPGESLQQAGQVRVLHMAGKEGAAAQAAAAAHHGEIDAGHAALHHRRDHVHVLAGAAFHELARAHLGQGLDLVPEQGGLLEAQVFGGRLHAGGELGDHLVVLAVQEQGRVLGIAGVILGETSRRRARCNA
jgi:hypothetical protein